MSTLKLIFLLPMASIMFVSAANAADAIQLNARHLSVEIDPQSASIIKITNKLTEVTLDFLVQEKKIFEGKLG